MKLASNILAVAGTITLALLPVAATADTAKLPAPVISEDLAFTPQSIAVLSSTMSYIETGSGDPVLFIHGNPTSSYLWRNVLPHIADTHRAIAVDLIGMGASGKPDIAYDFADHARFLDAFVEEMALTNLTLVGHDWGAALAWDFARRHPDRVTRILDRRGHATVPVSNQKQTRPTRRDGFKPNGGTGSRLLTKGNRYPRDKGGAHPAAPLR